MAKKSTGATEASEVKEQPPKQTAAQNRDKQEKVVKALLIAAAREGFRRAGRAWSVAPTMVALADLTADQIKQLRDEPALVVREIDGEI